MLSPPGPLSLCTAYLEASVLFTRLLQAYERIELAHDAQPADSYLHGRREDGLQPVAPVITLHMRGGVWVRFVPATV